MFVWPRVCLCVLCVSCIVLASLPCRQLLLGPVADCHALTGRFSYVLLVSIGCPPLLFLCSFCLRHHGADSSHGPALRPPALALSAAPRSFRARHAGSALGPPSALVHRDVDDLFPRGGNCYTPIVDLPYRLAKLSHQPPLGPQCVPTVGSIQAHDSASLVASPPPDNIATFTSGRSPNISGDTSAEYQAVSLALFQDLFLQVYQAVFLQVFLPVFLQGYLEVFPRTSGRTVQDSMIHSTTMGPVASNQNDHAWWIDRVGHPDPRCAHVHKTSRAHFLYLDRHLTFTNPTHLQDRSLLDLLVKAYLFLTTGSPLVLTTGQPLLCQERPVVRDHGNPSTARSATLRSTASRSSRRPRLREPLDGTVCDPAVSVSQMVALVQDL